MSNTISALIIEDDLFYAELITKWLRDAGLDEIEVVQTAEAGEAKLRESQPSIVFLDNYLPNIKGREVIELYQELSPSSVIVFMSSNFTVDDVIIGIRNQSNYIFDKEELSQSTIQKIIETFLHAKKFKTGFLTSALELIKLEGEENRANQILLLEDDPILAFRTKMMIHKGYTEHRVELFSSIKDILEYNITDIPDLAILDYNLPDGTNEVVVTYLNDHYPSVKILVHTSHADPQLALKLKNIGIHGYVVKDKQWAGNMEQELSNLIS